MHGGRPVHIMQYMGTGVSVSVESPLCACVRCPHPFLAAFGGGGPHRSSLVRLRSALHEVWQCGKGEYVRACIRTYVHACVQRQ